MKKIYGITMLSKRDAPSLHLDFFHTRNEHTARFFNNYLVIWRCTYLYNIKSVLYKFKKKTIHNIITKLVNIKKIRRIIV